MTTEGYDDPGTMADDSGIGTQAWASPDNAKTSNDSYASAFGTSFNSHWLVATNFGFTTPNDTDICDGVEVNYERADGSGTSVDNALQIWLAGGEIGDDKIAVTVWPSDDTVKAYGGSTDDWNAGLDGADLKNSGFGVALSVGTLGFSIPRVDDIEMRITFSVAPQFFIRRQLIGVGH